MLHFLSLAGKKAGAPRLALEKLRAKFGVKKLMLEGRGETNGSFLREDLVDELSLQLTVLTAGWASQRCSDVEGEQPRKAIANAASRVRHLGGDRRAVGQVRREKGRT